MASLSFMKPIYIGGRWKGNIMKKLTGVLVAITGAAAGAAAVIATGVAAAGAAAISNACEQRAFDKDFELFQDNSLKKFNEFKECNENNFGTFMSDFKQSL